MFKFFNLYLITSKIIDKSKTNLLIYKMKKFQSFSLFFRLKVLGEFGRAGSNATFPTPIVASSPPATTAFAATGSATVRHRPTAVRAATAATLK